MMTAPVTSPSHVLVAPPKTEDSKGSSLATTSAAKNPRSIATPPSRGMGTSWTSRSRTSAMKPYRMAASRTSPVVR
jgi:hypothetical protein